MIFETSVTVIVALANFGLPLYYSFVVKRRLVHLRLDIEHAMRRHYARYIFGDSEPREEVNWLRDGF